MGCIKFVPLFMVYIATTSAALAECIPWHSSYAQKQHLKVGSITIKPKNIFNLAYKKENQLIHKAANKLHRKTRISTIRSLLLFSENDPFILRKIKETERNIRKQRYIKSAHVSPIELCGNKVNILVKTHDNWTLTPGVSFSRSGGNNSSGAEIQEHNLLGLGKSLSFSYRSGVERQSKLFKYSDPQLFGSRKSLSLSFKDNSDGKGYAFDLSLPFYELDSKYSWGLSTAKLKQKTSLYDAGKVSNKITDEHENYTIFYGWSGGRKERKHQSLAQNSYSRFKVGWTLDQIDFLESSDNLLPSPVTIKESYPWIEYNHFTDHYITKTNFKTMGKVEDIALGRSITLGVGLLNKSFGSDDNFLKVSASYSQGYEIGSNYLSFLRFENDSYLNIDSNNLTNSRNGSTTMLEAELAHFNQRGNDLSLSLKLKSSDNLLLNQTISLGGKTGLRGYPKSYSTGTKSLLFQAEKRFHFDWYPLHLAKFGAVIFSDVGTTWGSYNDDQNGELLADIGIGLRIIPTRSSSAKTIQLDLAFPLTKQKNNHGNLKNYQFLISTSKSF